MSQLDDLTPLSSADIADKGIAPLPDVPELSAAELKAKFDEIPTTVLMPKINEIIQRANELLAEIEDLASIAEIQGLVTAEQIQTWTNAAQYPYSPNLLHNSDWGYSLVNQRVHTGAVSDAYCIDRWIGNGTVTPSAGSHIELTSGTTMEQRMEIIPAALSNKNAIFSYEDNSGSVHTADLTFPSTINDLPTTVACGDLSVIVAYHTGSYTLNSVSCSAVPYIQITANAAVNVRRVWLELGSICHMEKTPPNDYALNLYICCRYFHGVPKRAWGHFGMGFGSNATQFTGYFPMINMLRNREPAILMYGSTSPNLFLDQATSYELSNPQIRVDGTLAYLTFQCSSAITVGRVYEITARGTAPTLSFSADL